MRKCTCANVSVQMLHAQMPMRKCPCANAHAQMPMRKCPCANAHAQMYMRKRACVTVKCTNVGAQCFMRKCRQPLYTMLLLVKLVHEMVLNKLGL
jgi:hypothetical protein